MAFVVVGGLPTCFSRSLGCDLSSLLLINVNPSCILSRGRDFEVNGRVFIERG